MPVKMLNLLNIPFSLEFLKIFETLQLILKNQK